MSHDEGTKIVVYGPFSREKYQYQVKVSFFTRVALNSQMLMNLWPSIRPDHDTEKFVPCSFRMVYAGIFMNKDCETGIRFIVLTREDLKVKSFVDVITKAVLSPRLCKVSGSWSGRRWANDLPHASLGCSANWANKKVNHLEKLSLIEYITRKLICFLLRSALFCACACYLKEMRSLQEAVPIARTGWYCHKNTWSLISPIQARWDFSMRL